MERDRVQRRWRCRPELVCFHDETLLDEFFRAEVYLEMDLRRWGQDGQLDLRVLRLELYFLQLEVVIADEGEDVSSCTTH